MKAITFNEYLEEYFASDYTWCDDNMPDAYWDWVSNLSDEELQDKFDLYINSEYVIWKERQKYINFIKNLIS